MLEMINGAGQLINVDPENVDAVLHGAKGHAVLKIGVLGVVVTGKPDKVASEIGKARKRKCPVEKYAGDDGEGEGAESQGGKADGESEGALDALGMPEE